MKGENFLLEATIKSRARTTALRGKSLQKMRVQSKFEGTAITSDPNCMTSQFMRCETLLLKKRAARGFVWIQHIRMTNPANPDLLSRRRTYGTISILMYESERCGFFQTCATPASQPPLILLSIITTPNWN